MTRFFHSLGARLHAGLKGLPHMRKLWIVVIGLAVLCLAACAAPLTTNTPPVSATATLPSIPTKTGPTPVPALCVPFSEITTPDPTKAAKYPPITDQDWSEGSQDARFTLLEYSDFQCPYCAAAASAVKQLLTDYPQDVRLVYRHFPLPKHDKAMIAAQAAEAAGLQGKFWEMHDALFAAQDTWAAMTLDQFDAWLVSEAKTLGLNVVKFKTDLVSAAIVNKVSAAQADAVKLGVSGTPTFVLNGADYSGPWDYPNLAVILKLDLLKDRQYTSCPEITIDLNKQYIATLHTEKGDIVIQLYAREAPTTVNSFIFLAKHGWYNNVIFHRVIPGFLAQTGDPTGTGFAGPGYTFANELYPGLEYDKAGVVGMANSGPDSNGSQFFITMAAQPDLDGDYPIFGMVIQGMDVVNKLTPRDPSQAGEIPAGDKIISVSIEEK
jgi:cyclophilin family peptidyl-prolyl cis-trans isomerase/protein-disulfide isomerase